MLYRPGPRWNREESLFDQEDINDHRDFLSARFEDKTLVIGGPFLDNSGGISIFRHSSQAELEKLLHSDPTIETGLQIYEIHPCALPFAPVELE
ncbi:MAG TPA: YciI family protein [Candidatus Tumulicola sp.]